MSALKADHFDEWWYYWSSDFSTEKEKAVASRAWEAAERAATIRQEKRAARRDLEKLRAEVIARFGDKAGVLVDDPAMADAFEVFIERIEDGDVAVTTDPKDCGPDCPGWAIYVTPGNECPPPIELRACDNCGTAEGSALFDLASKDGWVPFWKRMRAELDAKIPTAAIEDWVKAASSVMVETLMLARDGRGWDPDDPRWFDVDQAFREYAGWLLMQDRAFDWSPEMQAEACRIMGLGTEGGSK